MTLPTNSKLISIIQQLKIQLQGDGSLKTPTKEFDAGKTVNAAKGRFRITGNAPKNGKPASITIIDTRDSEQLVIAHQAHTATHGFTNEKAKAIFSDENTLVNAAIAIKDIFEDSLGIEIDDPKVYFMDLENQHNGYMFRTQLMNDVKKVLQSGRGKDLDAEVA